MSQTRLFVAIPIHPDWLEQFGKYRQLLEQKGKHSFLRFHPLNFLHVTVLFIGDVHESDVPDISKEIEHVAASHTSFFLTLNSIRYMEDARKRGGGGLAASRRKKKDMLWASFAPHQRFVDLVEDVRRAVTPFTDVRHISGKKGLTIHPHTTLARFRNEMERPSRLPTLPECGLEEEKMPVTEFYLEQSDKSMRGKKYDIVHQYFLKP